LQKGVILLFFCQHEYLSDLASIDHFVFGNLGFWQTSGQIQQIRGLCTLHTSRETKNPTVGVLSRGIQLCGSHSVCSDYLDFFRFFHHIHTHSGQLALIRKFFYFQKLNPSKNHKQNEKRNSQNSIYKNTNSGTNK
jgi:hypothetical protein